MEAMMSARRGRPPKDERPLTFAGDLLVELRAGMAASLVRSRLGQRDVIAKSIARELDAPQLAAHLRVLAKTFGVSVVDIRAAVALEVARARLREGDARRAVQGGEP
jgi:hypothetical protein